MGFKISGRGKSRITFVIDNEKVIKISHTVSNYQNKNEYNVLSNVKSKLLPEVYDHAPDFSWIEVELVRPLNSIEDFENLSQVKYNDFNYITSNYKKFGSCENIVKYKLKQFDNDLDEAVTDYLYGEIDYYEVEKYWRTYGNNLFLKEIDKLLEKINLSPTEFSKIDNLGENSKGEIVLLDVGVIH